jgi:hypothetical protein
MRATEGLEARIHDPALRHAELQADLGTLLSIPGTNRHDAVTRGQ